MRKEESNRGFDDAKNCVNLLFPRAWTNQSLSFIISPLQPRLYFSWIHNDESPTKRQKMTTWRIKWGNDTNDKINDKMCKMKMKMLRVCPTRRSAVSPTTSRWKDQRLEFMTAFEMHHRHRSSLFLGTVGSRSDGSAYNKNLTLTIFLYIPLGCFYSI